jgi:hypothetical protein
MKSKYWFFAISIFFFASFMGQGNRVNAQILKPVKWTYGYEKINSKSGYVVVTASIGKGWHIYAQGADQGDGPIPTSFKFDKSSAYLISGLIVPSVKPKVSFDQTFRKNIGVHENRVVFKQKVFLNIGFPEIKGSLEFMVCNDHQCLPPEDLDFKVKSN